MAGRFGILDALMIFCAQYLIYFLVLGVLLMWIRHHHFKNPHWRDLALVSFGSAVVGRWVVAVVIRFFYYHPRPYWVLANTHLLLAQELESSFPSGHTIFAFALATGVYIYNKRVGKWYLWLAGLIGFSRIFVGVHWPYDIIGGIAFGIPTAFVCNEIYHKFFKPLIDRWF